MENQNPNFQGRPMSSTPNNPGMMPNQSAPIQQNPQVNQNPQAQQFVNQPQQQPQQQYSAPQPGQTGQPIQQTQNNQQFANQQQFQQQQFVPGNTPLNQARANLPGQNFPPNRNAAIRNAGPNPKSLIMGCLGFFSFSIILFVVFVLFFVSQTSSSGENGLAKALNVNPAEFTNNLVTLTNLIFGVVVIITFFVGVFGLFRAAMAPKMDKPAKSAGYKQAGIAGIVFLIMTTMWVFVYLYLNGKKVDVPKNSKVQQLIVTTPEETTKLIAPIDIKFDATQIPLDAKRYEITFYQWDFGDGASSTSPIVTHTYTAVGQYQVGLAVTAREKTTNKSETQSFSKLVTVSSVQVNGRFTTSPDSGPAPLKVDFDASESSSPAGQITNYEWDFKGQNNFRDATGSKASFTFDKEGTYTVKLRVTDNTGQSNITSKEIVAGGPDVPVPVIDIPTADGKYYLNKQLNFQAEKSTSPNGQITKYEWDFGDSTPKANTRTSNHTYTKAGLYEVSLKVTDESGKTATVSQKLNLVSEESAPQAIITTIPSASAKDKFITGPVPFEVRFDASTSTDSDNNIVEYKWDFDGDGKIDASGENTAYIYKTPGSYNATLTAIDAKENQSSAVIVVKTTAQDLQARLNADKVEGNIPLKVTFDATASSYPDGQITSYEWDFGDGTPKRIDAAQISYEYSSIGTFTASVLAKASDGKTSKSTININARPIALKACFTPSVEEGEAPLDVELDPYCSKGPVVKYLWDFGDGQTSRTRKPTHTFEKAGSYQVTLEVTDSSSVVNSYSKDILVKGTVTP